MSQLMQIIVHRQIIHRRIRLNRIEIFLSNLLVASPAESPHVFTMRVATLLGTPALQDTTSFMSHLLVIENKEQFRQYAQGWLYAHVLAIRANSSSTCDVIVTDYTSNSDIVSEWIRINTFGGHIFPYEQLFHLRIPLSLLKQLCREFESSTHGMQLFEADDTGSNADNWIDVSCKYCLVRLQLTFQKKSAGSTGNVRDLSIVNVDKTHDIEQFWMRFMTLPLVNKPGMITAKRSTVMLQLQASHTVDFHSSDSGPIKIENLDSDYDSQVKLQDALEQASQYGQPSKDHNSMALAQAGRIAPNTLHSFHALKPQPLQSSSASQQQSARQTVHSAQFLTQVLGFPTQEHSSATSEESYPFSFMTEFSDATKNSYCLAALNEVPKKTNNKIYHTEAVVLGTVPEISRVVVKACSISNGNLTLSDPQISSLELIVADSLPIDPKSDSLLSSNNSLSVHIPSDEVLGFFGTKFPEELYTKLQHLQNEFDKRSASLIPIQLTLFEYRGVWLWKPRNLSFTDIISVSRSPHQLIST